MKLLESAHDDQLNRLCCFKELDADFLRYMGEITRIKAFCDFSCVLAYRFMWPSECVLSETSLVHS